ncbi:restriction endonuclease subunit S [uncultured Stenotrophomonas sp.]|uniref:restriction endonuclease subunit S n=1 Tax=uncultured Stenotrophomonas sp. TaxID=165438 RepID=UPI0025D24EE6|nr:restriction endonuclease subunit S [uncultured Stenotrophomonas sp.]
MSGTSLIDRLLDGLVVEWVSLGSLGELVRGHGLQKNDLTEKGVPAIHYGQIYTHYGLSATKTKSFVSLDVAKQLRKVSKGDVVITNTSENIEDVAKALVYLGEAQAVTGGHATILKPGRCLLGKYFAYFAQTNQFAVEKKKYAKGEKVIDVSATDLAKIPIPIPCPEDAKKSLEIQTEIVRVLDVLAGLTTELTAELSAEMTARRKQYSHYRDQLLNFEGVDVEWKALPEMALDFGRGKSKHRPRGDERLYGGSVPFIQTGDIRSASHVITKFRQTYSDFGLRQSKLWPKGTLCITIAANIAETSILGFDACFPDSVIGFLPDSKKTSAGYAQYVLQSLKAGLEGEARGKGGAQGNINLDTFRRLKLPFPSPEEQARIVALLDRFDAMTNSLVDCLLREIDMRQKQYAYYRDLLFSSRGPDTAEV